MISGWNSRRKQTKSNKTPVARLYPNHLIHDRRMSYIYRERERNKSLMKMKSMFSNWFANIGVKPKPFLKGLNVCYINSWRGELNNKTMYIQT